MPDESVEVLIARMGERMKFMQEEMVKDRDGRKDQYQKIEEVGRAVLKLDGRMASVESSLAKASPTIEEFITIKHKVVGAGLAGKWVWMGAGALMTTLVYLREGIAKWLSN